MLVRHSSSMDVGESVSESRSRSVVAVRTSPPKSEGQVVTGTLRWKGEVNSGLRGVYNLMAN
jgi:hypothetical protein